LVAATERVNFIGIHRQYSYPTNILNKLIAANKEQRNKEENNVKQFKTNNMNHYAAILAISEAKELSITDTLNKAQVTYADCVEADTNKEKSKGVVNSIHENFGINKEVIAMLVLESQDVPKEREQIFQTLQPTIISLIKTII
jgi:hypothetical protein